MHTKSVSLNQIYGYWHLHTQHWFKHYQTNLVNPYLNHFGALLLEQVGCNPVHGEMIFYDTKSKVKCCGLGEILSLKGITQEGEGC